MTSLSSSTPISRRSSRMSGVPSTPSTPGRDRAVASRSSSAGRLAIAMETEGIAGSQTVDHVDRERRHLDALVRGRGKDPLGALLDHGQLQAALQERIGSPLRIGLADSDLALLPVADRDGDVLEGLADLLR